ncbi:hypothetical protein Dimus_012388 [Dionaea muscipula]
MLCVEHVATKTTVQIRSHAQKFFSKVARHTSSEASSIKPIEIPPPRPKRKPMHPYPRKLVPSPKKESCHLEFPVWSSPPNSSVSEQENQSPTSVLSAVVSDTLGSADSNAPEGCPFPDSSDRAVNNIHSMPTVDDSPRDDNASESTQDELVSAKLDLFPKVEPILHEGSDGANSTRSLMLFGKRVLVNDLQKPSSPQTCVSESVGRQDRNSIDDVSGNAENPWNLLSWGSPPAVYYLNADSVQANSTAGFPIWALYGTPVPFALFDNCASTKQQSSDCKFGEVVNKENHKQGSWMGSNTGHVCAVVTNSDRNIGDVEYESHLCSSVKDSVPDSLYKLGGKLISSGKRQNPNTCMKGFVPYKRCLSEKITRSSSTITGDEDELQRTRLSL